MKGIKLITALAAVIAVCSCEKETLVSDGWNFQKATLTAFCGDETKTTIQNGGNKVYWHPGDEVKLFYDGVGSRFTSTNTENAEVATFEGMISTTVNFNEGFSSSKPIWGLSPFNDAAESDGSCVKTVLPSAQSSPEGSFDPKAYITLGKSTSLSMGFYAVCGGIRFSVGRSDITSVTFSGNGGESLAGEIKLTMEDGLPSIKETAKPATEITVLSADGGAFKPGSYYYAVTLPVSFKSGFTMTFYTADGKQGSYRSTVSNTVKRGVFSTINNADSYVSSWADSPSGPSGNLRSGIYLGINAFNQALYPCQMQRLTESSKDAFNTFINGLTSKNGTILYYAADKSISAMQQATYPADICDAVLVTFTDGLDQGSIMLDSRYTSDDAYLSAVNSRLCSEKVAGLPVTSYAIGIRGNDVSDVTKFRNNLRKLSNPESNYSEVTDMSEVNAKFQEIADKVNQKTSIYKVGLTIPGQSDGTRIRFTFDDVTSASNSKMYVEGIFNLASCSLTDVTYHGLISSTGATVAGTVEGIFVSFVFDLICEKEGATINKNYVRQWNYVASNSSWQKNSEFDAAEDTDIRREKRSVAVMFVLDCSKSLGSGLSTIQSYVKSFITTLYNASFDPGEVLGVSLDVSKLTLGKGGSRALSAIISPSTAENRNVVWTSSNPTVATVDTYGTVKAIAEGTATISVRTVEGGYTASCKVTVQDFSNMPANCYVIKPGSTKSFAAVKGNSSESVGSVSGVSVLWESFGTSTKPSVGDVVKSVSYSGGKISVTTGSKEGNAVVAAKDASGSILWSWHIWVTSADLDALAQTYNNNAGTMMDRNLGATSATKGDVRSLGLLYQWGRKDPFLGSSSISSNTPAASTITWPSAENASSHLSGNTTLSYSTSHPTTYLFKDSSPYDWYCTSSSYRNDNLWKSANGGKTIYDPCPAGWRVPDGGDNGVWAKAFGRSSYWTTSSNWDSTNRGMDFSKTDIKLGNGTIWYPAAGYRYFGVGSLYNVGIYGNYWSCTSNDYYAYYLYFSLNGGVYPSGGGYRADGQSVRCLRE